MPGSTAVSEAVARNLFKLMAIKDEYEVGRLYTDDPDIGINDVSVELVRVGLVRRTVHGTDLACLPEHGNGRAVRP